MAGPEEFYIPVKLSLKSPLIDPAKLRIEGDVLHYFLYQQDGTKQPMTCRNTRSNQFQVAWMQIHDSPLTGRSEEELARREIKP